MSLRPRSSRPLPPSKDTMCRVIVHSHAHDLAFLVLDKVNGVPQALAEGNRVLPGARAAFRSSALPLLGPSLDLYFCGLLFHLDVKMASPRPDIASFF